MAVKRRNKIVLLFVVILISLVSVGLIVGFFVINAAVIEQFGSPSNALSFTQRLIYPLELYFYSNKLTSPTDLAGIGQTFEVDQGESVSMVCFRLEQKGLIADAELLRIYLVYSGLDRHLKSGQFKLSSAMSPFQIAQEFLDVTQKDAIVTILPGWRIEEVAANVAGSGLAITAEEFIHAAYAPSSRHLTYLPIDEAVSLEGFLFPGSYVMPREFDLDSLLETVLTEFTHQVDATLMDGFTRQGLTIYEAVNLASIIEKEAVVDNEKPMIASVLFNRLAEDIRLQTDPTVQYALGFQSATQTWWKSPLSLDDLTVNSPYNTYTTLGLPPTPICSPDLGSLRAVAFPAETPYYFFRAACDGSGRHNFAITFEEHLNNACE
jgi:UPF0755 protein